MSLRKEIEHRVAREIESLKHNKSHSEDEIRELCKTMSVNTMKSPELFSAFAVKNSLSLTDVMTIITWIGSMSDYLKSIKVSSDVTYDKSCEYFEEARIKTIVLHRVNYILHDALITVYDILEREKRMKFAVKKAANEAEKVWNDYYNRRKILIEKSAWFTLQDHLRITNDFVAPYTEKVYSAIRDYMISKGIRDVEVKARCTVALLIGKVVKHSTKAFFREYEKECGVDYSDCFGHDDIYDMMRPFARLCDAVGVQTKVDEYGCYTAVFDVEGSQRFKWAWDEFVKTLRNDELMDESAKKAIELNPDVQREYSQILEEEQHKVTVESVSQLADKYKVFTK